MPDRRRLLWIPWIGAHGDRLIHTLAAGIDADFVPVRLFAEGHETGRRAAGRCAAIWPRAFRHAVMRRIETLAPADALIVTFDWNEPMRLAVDAARTLGLPTVLVPHESVFFDSSLFYRDRQTGTDRPSADIALVWGGAHRDTFVARGYPSERIAVVGSPKLDGWITSRPALSRAAFAAACGLEAGRPLVLFAAQPLDNVADPETARLAQRDAVLDAHAAAVAAGAGFMLRLPPGDRPYVLGDLLTAALGPDWPFAVQRPPFAGEAARIEETLHHADVVVSLGSTLLVEAALIGRPSLAAIYPGVPEAFATLAGLPIARDRAALAGAVAALLAPGCGAAPTLSAAGRERLGAALGPGTLADGQSVARIAAAIDGFLAGRPRLEAPGRPAPRPDGIDAFAALQQAGLPRKWRRIIEEPRLLLRRFGGSEA